MRQRGRLSLPPVRFGIGSFLKKLYNQKRLHSALGYWPPTKFETQLAGKNLEVGAK